MISNEDEKPLGEILRQSQLSYLRRRVSELEAENERLKQGQGHGNIIDENDPATWPEFGYWVVVQCINDGVRFIGKLIQLGNKPTWKGVGGYTITRMHECDEWFALPQWKQRELENKDDNGE
jgi:hypothetical protein